MAPEDQCVSSAGIDRSKTNGETKGGRLREKSFFRCLIVYTRRDTQQQTTMD